MKREKRLPDVLLMSDKASTFMSNSTQDACICVESDGQSVSFKDEPSEGVTMDITAEYRNIVSLWGPCHRKASLHRSTSLLVSRRKIFRTQPLQP